MSDSYKQPVILQVLPELRSGGVERGTIEIARAIVQAGGKALVASAGGPMVAQLAHAGAKHVQMPLATKNPLRLWLNARKLAKLMVENDVNIIHARSRAPAWSAWLAAQRGGRRLLQGHPLHLALPVRNSSRTGYGSRTGYYTRSRFGYYPPSRTGYTHRTVH